MTPVPTDAQIARLYHPEQLAVAFVGLHRERLRYVPRWRCWMTWDGARWRPDDTLRALDLARGICRNAVNVACRSMPQHLGSRTCDRLSAPAASAAIERLARADRRLATSPGQWDAAADLLNTPAGIIDTRTGAVTPHRPDAYITRITAVAPAAPGTPCPAWDALLDRMTGGDAELRFFLQRVAGRALVRRGAGSKPAQAACGDPLLLDTIARILGDDGAAAAIHEGIDLVRLDDVAPDPDLADRLIGEYPAILRWAIDGSFAWRRIGLAPPSHAKRPAASEAIRRFLAEDTEASPPSWASAGDLYARWREWTEAEGIECGSQKSFCQAVAACGFQPARRHGDRRGFAGLRLRNPDGAGTPMHAQSGDRAEQASPCVSDPTLAHRRWERVDDAPFDKRSGRRPGEGFEAEPAERGPREVHASANAPEIHDAPSRALTLPSPRGPFGKSSGGPLPLPPAAGEGISDARHHAADASPAFARGASEAAAPKPARAKAGSCTASYGSANHPSPSVTPSKPAHVGLDLARAWGPPGGFPPRRSMQAAY